MKQSLLPFRSLLIVAAGLLLLCYPYLADTVNGYFAVSRVLEFEQEQQSIPKEDQETELLAAREYNEALRSGMIRTGSRTFECSLLEPGAVIGSLRIPEIRLTQTFCYGTSENILRHSPGLLERTSLPVGGAGTHAVISAHTGLAAQKLFTDLDRLSEGDVFYLEVLGERMKYEVDRVRIVLPEETEYLQIEDGLDLVTLLTCTPFGVNDHRLLVRGIRTELDPKEENRAWQTQGTRFNECFLLLAGCVWVFLLCIVLKVLSVKHKRKKGGRRDENTPF